MLPTLLKTNNKIRLIYEDGDYFRLNFQELTKQKKTVDIIFDDIFPLYMKSDNKVLLLKSGTSSGKSSVFIKYLYEFMKNKFKNRFGIILTQPKIALVENKLEDWVNIYPDTFKLKENLASRTSKAENRIMEYKGSYLFVCTTEIFNNMYLYNRENLKRYYKFVVIDEVHEVSVEIITALKNIKEWTESGEKDIPYFILMSATMDIELLANYFNIKRGVNGIIIENQKQLNTQEKMKEFYLTEPIEDRLISKNITNIFSTCMNHLITNDWLNTNCRDILIFMAGNLQNVFRDIILFIESNEEMKKIKRDNNIHFLPVIYAAYNIGDDNENMIIFNKPIDVLDKEYKKKVIKIIISTNILESGATIPSIRFCIDTGYRKQLIPYLAYREPYDSKNLTNIVVSYNSFIQRKGRIGRVYYGEFYGVYTKSVADNLEKKEVPILYYDASITTNLRIFATSEKIKMNYNRNNYVDFILSKCQLNTIINNPLISSDYIYSLSPEIINYNFVKMYKLNLLDKYGNTTFYTDLIESGNMVELLKIIFEMNFVNPFDRIILLGIFEYFTEYDTIDSFYYLEKYDYKKWITSYFNVNEKNNLSLKEFLLRLVELFNLPTTWNNYFIDLVRLAFLEINYYDNYTDKTSIFLGNYDINEFYKNIFTY